MPLTSKCIFLARHPGSCLTFLMRTSCFGCVPLEMW